MAKAEPDPARAGQRARRHRARGEPGRHHGRPQRQARPHPGLGVDRAAARSRSSRMVPTSEILRYAIDLRSMTGGRGRFTATPLALRPGARPPRRQDRGRGEGTRALSVYGRARAADRGSPAAALSLRVSASGSSPLVIDLRRVLQVSKRLHDRRTATKRDEDEVEHRGEERSDEDVGPSSIVQTMSSKFGSPNIAADEREHDVRWRTTCTTAVNERRR